MTDKKRKSRRNKVKHASLKTRYNSRIRQEAIDMDYLDKLDDTVKNCKLPNGEMATEMEYLSRFMEEWNNASVTKQSEAENNTFHRTAELTKDCTDRNNARQRDILSQAKAQNRVINGDYYTLLDLIDEMETAHTVDTENILIDILDEINELKKSDDDSD